MKGSLEVLSGGGNVTSDFMTECLGESTTQMFNQANVREKHPKKKEQHMQRLQGKLSLAHVE